MEDFMVDLRTILDAHRGKSSFLGDVDAKESDKVQLPTNIEIPSIFFDEILVHYKLNRVEIMVLMYLYRQVYNQKNMFKDHGISKLISHTEMVNTLHIEIEDIHNVIKKLEDLGFIETIRLGQYFVRKYFTKEYDSYFSQTYNDFEA